MDRNDTQPDETQGDKLKQEKEQASTGAPPHEPRPEDSNPTGDEATQTDRVKQ